MHRTQIYLPDDAYEDLTRMSQERGLSMAELVREAVRRYLDEEGPGQVATVLERTHGSWRDRDEDSRETVRRLRQEWNRRGEVQGP